MPQASRFRLNILGLQKSWIYTIPARSESIIIGRGPECDILLEHQHVSRRHVELRCTPIECAIIDLHSANGTRLNGQKITPGLVFVLKPGDSIQIGAFNLDFEQIPIEPSYGSEKMKARETTPLQEEPVLTPQPPATPPPPGLPDVPKASPLEPSSPPFDFTFRGERLLSYLPGIYHTKFMAEFLATFESVLLPIEWQIDGFDLFLDPGTTPAGFLPWLANWFEFVFDSTWSESQQRIFLKEAYWIYSRSGTRSALSRILEIYTGYAPEIDDQSEDLAPHTFRVKLPRTDRADRDYINRLINAYKPAHTACILELEG